MLHLFNHASRSQLVGMLFFNSFCLNCSYLKTVKNSPLSGSFVLWSLFGKMRLKWIHFLLGRIKSFNQRRLPPGDPQWYGIYDLPPAFSVLFHFKHDLFVWAIECGDEKFWAEERIDQRKLECYAPDGKLFQCVDLVHRIILGYSNLKISDEITNKQ